MIIEYRFFAVRCDLCKREYSNPTNIPSVFLTIDEAEKTITSNGWIVMHNQRGSYPRILCLECNKEVEEHVQNDSDKEIGHEN